MGKMAEKKGARIRRRSRSQEEDDKPDRFSDLPDAIIHQILSFIDVKYAIQTSVLSKRWKHLWVSLPDLKFDGEGFTYSKFAKFVRKVLSTRSADCNICNFQLHSRFKLDHCLVKRILNYVVSHNVQHLNIRIGNGPSGYTCSCLSMGPFLTCNTFKILELSNCLFKDLSESFSFGFTMLTSMNLANCGFHYESGFAEPFAACPNLKNLCLENCDFSSLRVLKISGLQLLNLKIEDWYFVEGKVEIFAPKLTSFYFGDSVIIDFSSLDIPSLCYADIWLEINDWEHRILGEREEYGVDLIKLLRGLYNAEVVRLSANTIKFLKCFPSLEELLPVPFKRLKSLKVECDGKSLTIPDQVKKYLLGDDLYEETRYTEATPYRKIRYAEFRKVQSDV